MMNKQESYIQAVKDVIKWNAIARDEKLDDQIDVQVMVTLEEINEAFDAISKGKHKETLFEIADVLVTAGYLAFLHDQDMETLEAIVDVNEGKSVPDGLAALEKMMQQIKEEQKTEHIDVYYLVSWACFFYGKNTVFSHINAVLKSNESKFIQFGNGMSRSIKIFYLSDEIKAATKKYSNRYQNITDVSRSVNNQEFFVLRADYGKGKIVKPLTYKEPDHFLST